MLLLNSYQELLGGERTMQTQKGRGRGFASMSPEKKREIASKGGKAAHALGTAHKWTSEEAQAAGRKGGSISRRRSKLTAQA
jgi:general stress protein YciG